MDTYWSRYRRRWYKTYLAYVVVSILALASQLTGTPENVGAWIVNAVLASAVAGLVVGSLINFIVAAFPSRRKVDDMSG